jgi:hypothetical protein
MPSTPRLRLALVALAAIALGERSAVAEIGSERRPKSFFTPGPSIDFGLDGSLRFGGEVAVAQYSGSWGLGAAAGFVSSRLYLEAQTGLVLGGRPNNFLVGLNPGFVIDVSADVPRYGGQLTLWASYARDTSRLWASPIVPFVRMQAVVGMGLVLTGGLMLKLPIPVT